MKANEINGRMPFLKHCMDHAIKDAVRKVVTRCDALGTTPQEPDYIAGLSLYFTRKLYRILTRFFVRHQFSVTGIFCHQKPIVDIGIGVNPELGDILFVYIYTDSTGTKKYNSLLLQAKVSTAMVLRVPPRDMHQLTLYRDWPEFIYRRAGVLNGITRNIQPKVASDGAQYLLIDNDPVTGLAGTAGTFPMGCAIAEESLSVNANLANEIVDFIKFKAGRAFEGDPLATGDDWTKMIWDLVTIARGRMSRRRNAGFPRFPRQTVYATTADDGAMLSFGSEYSSFDDIRDSGGGSGELHKHDNLNDEGPGISVVLIEASEPKIG